MRRRFRSNESLLFIIKNNIESKGGKRCSKKVLINKIHTRRI